jgi:putative heme-binding domain-containing protein
MMNAALPALVQSAAVAAIGRISSPEAAASLLAGWNGSAPTLRTEIVTVLLTRPAWREALLDAVEQRQLAAGQIGTAGQQLLLRDSDPKRRERATALFQKIGADRQKVVDRYLAAIPPQGDASRGHEIFRTNCTICHRLKGEGNEVGPELGMVVGKPVDYLLTAILDPNQAIEARYIAYMATMKDGRAYTGVIASETTNGLTLKAPGGVEQPILRGDLKELVSLGRSLMPEGLEAAISPEQMADLIAFLRKP